MRRTVITPLPRFRLRLPNGKHIHAIRADGTTGFLTPDEAMAYALEHFPTLAHAMEWEPIPDTPEG